jgi:hypothetical protein
VYRQMSDCTRCHIRVSIIPQLYLNSIFHPPLSNQARSLETIRLASIGLAWVVHADDASESGYAGPLSQPQSCRQHADRNSSVLSLGTRSYKSRVRSDVEPSHDITNTTVSLNFLNRIGSASQLGTQTSARDIHLVAVIISKSHLAWSLL